MPNTVKKEYYYAEGYARNIKVICANKSKFKMNFELDSDLKEFKSLSEDSKPIYATSPNGDFINNVTNYVIGDEKDSFFIPSYVDYLMSNIPVHIGIYFKYKDNKSKKKFTVYRFRIIDEYR